MELFEHGGYLVLDGTRASLEHLAELLEESDGEDAEEVAGKITRGLDSGATRIAVERSRFSCVNRVLESADTGLAEALEADVKEGLEKLDLESPGEPEVEEDADEA